MGHRGEDMTPTDRILRNFKNTKSVSIVAAPDHPYVLVGPDLLLLDEEGLLCIFVAKAEEVRWPDLAMERLILALLAYPRGVRPLFVIPHERSESSHSLSNVLTSRGFLCFQEHKGSKLHRQLLAAANSHEWHPEVDPISSLQKASDITFRRAEIIYSAALSSAAEASQLSFDKFQKGLISANHPRTSLFQRPWKGIDEAPNAPDYEPTSGYRINGHIISALRLTSRTRATQIRRHAIGAFGASWALSENSLRLTKRPIPAIVTDRIPIHPADPLKWIRGSAFCGLGIFVATEIDTLQEQLEQVSHKLNEIT